MFYSIVTTAAFLLSGSLQGAQATDMKLYTPTKDVPAGFKAYLNKLYDEAEAPTATTEFTDFFTPTGTLHVLSYTASGAKPVLALKQALMPSDGSKVWGHYPKAVSVAEDTPEAITFQVNGVITTTYPTTWKNCSQADYETHFRVAKNNGVVDFTPQIGNLDLYHDYLISPDVSPNNVPCTVAQ